MAAPLSPEASEIRRRGRRRLLGAVTLVLLLVVFVPMILDSEPRPQRPEPSLIIPPKDNVAPLPAPAPAPAQAAAAKDAAPGAAPTQAPPAAPTAAKVEPKPAPQPAPAKVAAAPRLEGFAVQVGAFRDEARLTQARKKLEAAGVVHYTERVDGDGGPITRLRAGPFPTREAAEKARATLQHASIDGQVVPLP